MSNDVRLNIGCGPNVLPTSWINYDRADFSSYIRWINEVASGVTVVDLNIYALNVIRCVNFVKNNEGIVFKQHDLRKGFTQHEDNSITSIYIGQVIEHLNPIYEAPNLIKECYRMLKPGGTIRLATPDLEILLNAYLRNEMHKFANEQPTLYNDVDPSMQLSYIMFGACGQDCTSEYYEGHMFMYSQVSMTRLLSNCGFKDVEFHYEIGKSKDPVMAKDIADAGMTHSFIVEATK
jgi:predicted SAM-dependent methyltransferase